MVAARVAEGLGVGLMELVGIAERRQVVLMPRRARAIVRDPQTGFERQLLSLHRGTRGLEFTRNVVPEGSSSGEIPAHQKGTEEYVLVERGMLRAVIGGEAYLLAEGDALYFEADVAHRFDNAGEGACSYYVVLDGRAG